VFTVDGIMQQRKIPAKSRLSTALLSLWRLIVWPWLRNC